MSGPSSHAFLYERIKEDLLQGAAEATERIDLAQIADHHRISVTPVREVMFQLIGERIVELNELGGFRLPRLSADRLRALYMWQGQHLLTIVGLLPEPGLARTLQPTQQRLERTTDDTALFGALTRDLAAATGNSELLELTAAARDRLASATRAELLLFPDVRREIRSIARTDIANVRHNVRRRLLAYHRRRAEHAEQIASLIA